MRIATLSISVQQTTTYFDSQCMKYEGNNYEIVTCAVPSFIICTVAVARIEKLHCRASSTGESPVESFQFEVSSQHLFRYASEWDPRAPGHTKVRRRQERGSS